MLRYEMKKVFSKASGKIALVLLGILLIITCYFAVSGVSYVNEKGEMETGILAARKLREEKRKWEGTLSEEKIRLVLEENARICATPEYKSQEVTKQNMAYGWGQGFSDIRDLIAVSFGGFRDYNYYLPDSLPSNRAGEFYPNRLAQLKEWLDTEAKESFSESEKEFLIGRYEALETPLEYKDTDGWSQLFMYAPTIFMIMVFILGFLVSGIFSGEYQLKANSIFYTSFHGRGKAVTAKIKAGLIITTGIYWAVTLLYSVIVLGILGAGGAECAIQIDLGGWKNFHNITFGQEYLLLVMGGYVGTLAILMMTMLVSACTRSAVIAVIVPFLFIFLPNFLASVKSPVISKLIGLLPDQLLQVDMSLDQFNLYRIGGKITGALVILLILYMVLSALLCPLIYRVYKKAEVE